MEQSIVEKTNSRMAAAFNALSQEFKMKMPKTWLENLRIDYKGDSLRLVEFAVIKPAGKDEIEIKLFQRDAAEVIVNTLQSHGIPVNCDAKSIRLRTTDFVNRFAKSQFALTAVSACRKRIQLVYVDALGELRNHPERKPLDEAQLHKLLESYREKIDKLENSQDDRGDLYGTPVPRPIQPPSGEAEVTLPLPEDPQ